MADELVSLLKKFRESQSFFTMNHFAQLNQVGDMIECIGRRLRAIEKQIGMSRKSKTPGQ